MDTNFLEFWGNVLINAAKGQKQLDDFNRLVNQGLASITKFDDLTALFKKSYGIDRVANDSPDFFKTWSKSTEELQKSFQEYLKLMGMVPKSEHIALVKKYEGLKEKVTIQEETIKHLRMLLSEKSPDEGKMMNQFHELLHKQGEQFQELMNNFRKLYKSSEVPSEEKSDS